MHGWWGTCFQRKDPEAQSGARKIIGRTKATNGLTMKLRCCSSPPGQIPRRGQSQIEGLSWKTGWSVQGPSGAECELGVCEDGGVEQSDSA